MQRCARAVHRSTNNATTSAIVLVNDYAGATRKPDKAPTTSSTDGLTDDQTADILVRRHKKLGWL